MRALPSIPLLLLLAVGHAAAQSPPASASVAAPPAAAKNPPASHDDVASRLHEMQAPHAGLLELGPVSLFDRAWQDVNTRLEDAVGLRFGLAYTLTFQAATSGPGDRSGAEGDLDLFGAWRLLGKKDEPDAGTLNLNAQNIHTLGEVAPANLASEIGAIWGTSDGIGDDESFPVVQLYYEQRLFDDRVMAVIGKIDTTNYVGTNRYADDSLYFMNRAFSSNPAMNYPGNGLGAVLAGRITDRLYLGGCVADANGVETESGFNSIDAAEFFSAIEAGLALDIEGLGEGNYRLTAWHSDGASAVDLPEDFGFALSIDQELGHGVVPFFRCAWSDGDATGVTNIIAGGLALEGPFGRDEDALGLGLSWGEPTDDAFEDQVVSEVFYRLQLAPSIQWTLGAQAVFNALDLESDQGGEETVGIFEMRLRFTF